MHSILMMAVLSTSTAPGQYWYGGPCGPVYANPVVAYYPVQYSGGGGGESDRKVIHQKVEELAQMIARINQRLERTEDRFQAMEDKHRDMAQAFERKLEQQARYQHKAIETAIKDERVRHVLETVKEKTRFLEFSAKMMVMNKPNDRQGRLEKIQLHIEKLEAQLRKVERTLQTMVNNNTNVNSSRGPEGSGSLSETSDDQPIPDNRALIIVALPDNAKLFLNNQLRKGIARQRFILTPSLEDGEYSYTLRVDVDRDGRIQSQTRQVTFRRGMQVRVSFEP